MLIKCRDRYFQQNQSGESTNKKKRSRFESLKKVSLITDPKEISQKAFKKIIEEVAEILYDHYRQQQKISSALFNDSGEPQITREAI